MAGRFGGFCGVFCVCGEGEGLRGWGCGGWFLGGGVAWCGGDWGGQVRPGQAGRRCPVWPQMHETPRKAVPPSPWSAGRGRRAGRRHRRAANRLAQRRHGGVPRSDRWRGQGTEGEKRGEERSPAAEERPARGTQGSQLTGSGRTRSTDGPAGGREQHRDGARCGPRIAAQQVPGDQLRVAPAASSRGRGKSVGHGRSPGGIES